MLELAEDEICEPENAEVVSRVIGRPGDLFQPGLMDGYEPDEEMVVSGRFSNGEAYDSDIEAGWRDLRPMPVTERSNARGG